MQLFLPTPGRFCLDNHVRGGVECAWGQLLNLYRGCAYAKAGLLHTRTHMQYRLFSDNSISANAFHYYRADGCSDLASAIQSVVYTHAQDDECVWGSDSRHPEVGVWRAQKLRYDALLRTRPRFLPSLTCPLQIYIECFLSKTILKSFNFDLSFGIACKLIIVQVYNYSTGNSQPQIRIENQLLMRSREN